MCPGGPWSSAHTAPWPPYHLPRQPPSMGWSNRGTGRAPRSQEVGGPAALAAILQGGPCPSLAWLAPTSWQQDVRTAWVQFLTSGRTLALKGKEHRTLGAVLRAPLRHGVSTHLGGAGEGLCPRPPHPGSQPHESCPPGSGALIPP